jgi:hypothetical protein
MESLIPGADLVIVIPVNNQIFLIGMQNLCFSICAVAKNQFAADTGSGNVQMRLLNDLFRPEYVVSKLFCNRACPGAPLASLDDMGLLYTTHQAKLYSVTYPFGDDSHVSSKEIGIDASKKAEMRPVTLDHPAGLAPGQRSEGGIVTWTRHGHVRLFSMDLELLHEISLPDPDILYATTQIPCMIPSDLICFTEHVTSLGTWVV